MSGTHQDQDKVYSRVALIIIVMTRWSTKDLVGKVLNKQGDENADQWEVVEFPALMPKTEKPLWPEFWKKEELLGVKASLPISKMELSMATKSNSRRRQYSKTRVVENMAWRKSIAI